jgi:endoglucanase
MTLFRQNVWPAIALVALHLHSGNVLADCDRSEHRVRLNQLGFFPHGAKRAIISAEETEPLRWRLLDRSGETRLSGQTSVFGDDPVSGEHVHSVDFSEFNATGDEFRITTACGQSHPFDIGEQPYGLLAYDALAYFYHNRSGVPIVESFAGGEQWARPAGHERDLATCRTGKDSKGNRWPGCDYTLDLSGGWYDAGDQGKYVVNGGIATWTLLNFHERQNTLAIPDSFSDGQASIPEAGNKVSDLLDEARFEIEFLLRMQAPQGAIAKVPVNIRRNRSKLPFDAIDASGMAHHKVADVNWTALPTAPHEDKEQRVLYPVSTAATLNLAAVAAQCARIWRDIDAAFSERCLVAAERAYAAATRNPDVYFIADFSGSGLYGDTELSDEFFWAAAELFVTTGEPAYRELLKQAHYFSAPVDNGPAWPRVGTLGVISLAMLPNRLDASEIAALRQAIIAGADRFLAERAMSGYHIPFATDQYHWGSNSDVLNRAILLALAHDFSGNAAYRDAVIDAMDYILGRNPLDQSYVSGYGERSMQNPHHRFWAPTFDGRYPPPPAGALSGGPNSTAPADEIAKTLIGKCAPQTCWRDDLRAYSLNEVAINWNAPLVWVSAFLTETRQ